VHKDLITARSQMGGEFDFSKGQVPTNFPRKPGRGEVGDNIDRCITTSEPNFKYFCNAIQGVVISQSRKMLLCSISK